MFEDYFRLKIALTLMFGDYFKLKIDLVLDANTAKDAMYLLGHLT